ncbi:MAG: HDOD domain-containing protein [Candidatus Kuenenia sp.]|nr:HDOD domain-containing protein [Candidatus Kuenenia hertensis]
MTTYSVEEILETTSNLSYVPSVVIELNTVIAKTDINLNEILLLIEKDQGIVSRVFKVANSSFYGRVKKAENVKEAVLTLGFRGLQFLVIDHAMKNLMKNLKTKDDFLWKHAMKVSAASRILAKNLQKNLFDDAAVSGVIHDIGKAFIINVYPDAYIQVQQDVQKEHIHPVDAESNVFGFDHTKIGELITNKWNFPQRLIDVIHFHHCYDDNNGFPLESQKLIEIVKLADILTNKFDNYTVLGEKDIEENDFSRKLFDGKEDQIVNVLEEIKQEWEKDETII